METAIIDQTEYYIRVDRRNEAVIPSKILSAKK